MNIKAILSISLCVLACMSAPAFAGQKLKSDVIVTRDATGGSARGSIGTARNSLDGNQRIGCQVQATAGSTALTGVCDAASAAGGDLVFCTTTSPQLIDLIKSIGTDSYVAFSFGPAASGQNPTCTSLNVYNTSLYEAKKP
jgi:hypothetical protein